MPTHKIVSVQDGPRITVSTLVKNPTLIQRRLLNILANEFIIDSLLRRLPPTPSGAYVYEESTPLFADGEAAIVEEFGEIPVVTGKAGARKVAVTVKRALAFLISQEMINRNNMDQVNRQSKQIKNTMIRTWDTAFFRTLLNHPDVPTLAASAAWNGVGANIRLDLADGMSIIDSAAPDVEPDGFFGFQADTLVIGRTTRSDLITSDDFNKVYSDRLAPEAPLYKGTLPGNFFGLTVMVSREMDRLAPGRALLLERGTVGGIGDERALSATPLYEDRPRETWRSDLVRQSAVVIDQPKAAVWITGVSA